MTKQFIFDKIVCDETNNTKEEVAPGVFWLGGTLYENRNKPQGDRPLVWKRRSSFNS